MAANPVASVSEGLAAAASGAGTGGTADPLDNVRAIFTTFGMTTTHHDGMINVHNLTGMDDFDYIRVNDVRSFIKVWNDTSQAVSMKVGMPTQRKLQGFLYWYHDQKKRGVIPAAANFDATAMRLAVKKIDAEKSGKEIYLTDLDPGKIDMEIKWWPFKESLLNMSKNIMGVDNDPLYYIIRPDHPAGLVSPNSFKQRMYQLPHTRAVYNRENKMVWGKILKLSINTPSWEWIKEFEATEDSRSEWKLILVKCEEQDKTNKRVLLAT